MHRDSVKPKFVDCYKASILLNVFNIEQLLLTAVIKGWVEFFKFLIPYAKNEGIDFNKPFPNIQEEPYNKRPLLHNLVCTQHCNRKILGILLFEFNVDVFRKDGDGCRAVELAFTLLPSDIREIIGLPTLPNFDDLFRSEDPKTILRNRKYTRSVLFHYSDFLRARRSLDWPTCYNLYIHAFYNYELRPSMK